MTPHVALQFPRHIAASCIGGYQRHLSPRKGFRCAHRVLHGGPSCSQFVKRLVLERGVFAALPLARQRFRACHAAAITLRERALLMNEEPFEESSHLRKLRERSRARQVSRGPQPSGGCDPLTGNCCDAACSPLDWIDYTDCGCDLLSHAPHAGCDASHCAALDASHCAALDVSHCAAFDCGAIDCSACCSWP